MIGRAMARFELAVLLVYEVPFEDEAVAVPEELVYVDEPYELDPVSLPTGVVKEAKEAVVVAAPYDLSESNRFQFW